MMSVCSATTTSQGRAITSTSEESRGPLFLQRRHNYSPTAGLSSTTGGPEMRTVTLEVSSREETDRRGLRAFEGQPQGEIISFATTARMVKVLTQKRWELLSALTGAGPVTLREAARRVGRDVKAVHGDVH